MFSTQIEKQPLALTLLIKKYHLIIKNTYLKYGTLQDTKNSQY